MAEILQHLINGISLGSIYALIALGYTMVFGVLKLINFAHGDIYMLGAFIGMFTAKIFSLDQNPSITSLCITLVSSMIICAFLGFIIEKIAYRPLRKAPRINLLITAVGVSLFLEFTSQVLFGADPKFFPQVYVPAKQWIIGDLHINPLQVIILAVSLFLMLVLNYVVFKTKVGKGMRAVQFSHELASLMGIHTDKMISYTFMLGSSLAGAGGVLVGLAYPKVEPLMGVLPGLKAFSAAVLGGIGNIHGAFIGSLLIGLSEEFLVAYGAPSYRDALAFFMLILVLLFKPTGLFGKKTSEKV
ncbi:MAG: branched-chain amino acid ABC transporter permease [Bacteriovoracaceae bacterium]|nr:branched-chain amino acid ABC transporter permease [Bacteriovoracaceae bacterium]